MAKYYLPIIQKFTTHLILIEQDVDKCKVLQTLYPSAIIDTQIRQHVGTVAFVLSNTPSHVSDITQLLALKYTHIFVEKPLGLSYAETVQLSQRNDIKHIYVAYLMRFSGALHALRQWATAQQVSISHGHVEWGKDRTQEQRPSAGALEDESVHGMGILCDLFSDASLRHISAVLGFDPYVIASIQQKAHSLDASFPLMPSSSVSIQMQFEHNGVFSPASLCSSFLRLQRRRNLQATFRNSTQCFQVEIDFDQPQGDHLRIFQQGAALLDTHYPGNKIEQEITAFFAAVSGQVDARLTTFAQALKLLYYVECCKISHAEHQTVKV